MFVRCTISNSDFEMSEILNRRIIFLQYFLFDVKMQTFLF